MIFNHVDRMLTAYLHGELSLEEQEKVERHLKRCRRCRQQEIRLRALHVALPTLPMRAAPDTLWSRIEQMLDSRAESGVIQTSDTAPGREAQAGSGNVNPSPAALQRTHGWKPAIRIDYERLPSVYSVFSVVQPHPFFRGNRGIARLTAAISVVLVLAAGTFGALLFIRQRSPSWEVRTLQGRPAIGWFAFGTRGRLRVGDQLTTDAASRAEIEVADIGTVKIAPGSRVRLTATGKRQHRLELEQGALEAKVVAPPRLFVVDTHAGRAVDLGCAYRLETDGNRETTLRVTHGQVALEDAGRASLVPQGFSCESRRGVGLGTPIKEDARALFRQAIHQLDFESGGDAAAERARALARPQDSITLWHLLRRTSSPERGRLYDTLSGFVPPHESITRQGVVGGDDKMIDTWKEAILYYLAESEISR